MRQTEFLGRFKRNADLYSMAETKRISNAFWTTLLDMLEENGEINFQGIGKFKIRTIKGKEVFHPVTRKSYIAPDTKSVTFRNSSKLRARLKSK